MKHLERLWNEIVEHKYKYPLIQIYYAEEHISGLMTKLKKHEVLPYNS